MFLPDEVETGACRSSHRRGNRLSHPSSTAGHVGNSGEKPAPTSFQVPGPLLCLFTIQYSPVD